MKREIIQTNDGSTSIFLPEWNESYHSKNGAVQEAYHVFIKNGLFFKKEKTISILEIGFGTGLNTFITLLEAEKSNLKINYTGVEAYPISSEEIVSMNFVEIIDSKRAETFRQIHTTEWEVKNKIATDFWLTKRKQFFQEINDVDSFDLIYFDTFGYRVQPELWSVEIFKKMFAALKKKGVLVTYACRTSIKNAMKEAGFEVEKLPGAPGKREMLRAIKC